MKKLFLLVLLSPSAFALPEDFFRSASLGFTTVNSTSSLRTPGGSDVLEFEPDITSGTNISLETKYIALGYTFAGNREEYEKKESSDFQDIRLSFAYQAFDIRLNYQFYKGADASKGSTREFYSDYQVKAYNARAHYYFQDEYLKYIRDGRDLVRKSADHSGFSVMGSTFVGLNFDRRRITLPDFLIPEHQSQITKYGIDYDRHFAAITAGPLIGADAMVQAGTAFFRGKFGGGPAFQSAGTVVPQLELALGLGVAFFKRHMLSANADLYMLEFKDKDQRISNNNNQVNIAYTYAF